MTKTDLENMIEILHKKTISKFFEWEKANEQKMGDPSFDDTYMSNVQKILGAALNISFKVRNLLYNYLKTDLDITEIKLTE